MSLPVTADTCPSCTGVHGQPTDWPVCPEHGHWLYILRGPLAQPGTGWTYACQAPKCTHTHTQPERATMTTTTEAANAALAIRGGQDFWDAKQLAALAQLGIKDASNADLAVFMHYCQKTGLDPFSRQIYMIGRRVKDGGEWTTRQTIQVGIDGYRVIAQRAARRDGVTLSYGNTTWYDSNGQPCDVWVQPVPPAAAAVTVYRDGKPFPGVARFASFAAVTKEGQPMAQWATMPDHMIAKCAEAQALRKAFPHDLVGIHTDDETAHLGNRPPRMTLASAPALQGDTQPSGEPQDGRGRGNRSAPSPAAQDPETLKAAIRAHFDRLGLDDGERDTYMAQLTGEEDLTALTPSLLAKALSALESCDDIGHLHEITGTP